MNFLSPYWGNLASASDSNPITEFVSLTYGDSASAGYGVYYSANSQITSISVSITKDKKIIDKVEAVKGIDGQEVVVGTIQDAVGEASWSGTYTSNGNARVVKSEGNSNAPTYFAWYRYSNTSSDKSWFANEGLPTDPKRCESSETELIDGVSMPKFPGCTATVNFQVNRTIAYTLSDGREVPSTVVKVKDFSRVNVNPNVPVPGPEGTFGVSEDDRSNNPISNPVISQISSDNTSTFLLKYQQTFNSYPRYDDISYNSNTAIKHLPAPGARLMVYFGSFSFDIIGETYEHPNRLRITYKDAPPNLPPDLGIVGLVPEASCLAENVIASYKLTFENSGTAFEKSFNIQVKYNGSIIKTYTYAGMTQGQRITETFTQPTGAAGTKKFTVILDSGGALTTEASKANNTKELSFDFKTSCADEPPDNGPEKVTADFKFQYPQIEIGDSNWIMPQNTGVTGGSGCAIKEISYTISQNGNSITKKSSGLFTEQIATFAPSPAFITTGMVTVTMEVTSTCGGKATAGPKTFTIIAPASCTSSNSAPQFQAGWFAWGDRSSWEPKQQIALNMEVWLRNYSKPALEEGTKEYPYDPDGDPFIMTWDFAGSSSSWIKFYAEEYDLWEHEPDGHFIRWKATELGSHKIKVSAMDVCGNKTERTVSLDVVPPNPVPIISAPSTVIENRPFTQEIHGRNSYSPAGRTIVNYLWQNKQTVYTTPGQETIKLDVIDSAGLKSLAPASHTLTVMPDLPPEPRLEYNTLGLRAREFTFKDTSFSPDGDSIVEHTLTLRFDSNNNGSFDDETSHPITLDANNEFVLTPTHVGKFAVDIFLKEDWGKTGYKRFPYEIINDAPYADFYIRGLTYTPPTIETRKFTANEMLTSAEWKSTSPRQAAANKDYIYNAQEEALQTYDNGISSFRAVDLTNQTKSNLYWYCTNNVDNGCSRLYEMVTPNLFSTRGGFVKLDAPTRGKPIVIYDSIWKDIDYENDLAWTYDYVERVEGLYYYKNWANKLYRISDIQRSTENANFTAQPLQSYTHYSGYRNDWAPNPAPTGWKNPPAKADPNTGTIPYTWVRVDREDGTSYTRNTVSTPYQTDREGNTFNVYCYSDYANNNYENCRLQKYTSQGAMIFDSPVLTSSQRLDIWMTTSFIGSLHHVSSNNKYLIWRDMSSFKVIDNTTGALVHNIFPAYRGHLGYVGKNGDTLVFTKSTTKAIIEHDEDEEYIFGFELLIYNSETNQFYTHTFEDARTYNYFGYSEGIDATLTADNKIMVVTGKYQVFTFDLEGNMIQSIPGSNYFLAGLDSAILSSDGQFRITRSDDSDDDDYSVTVTTLEGQYDSLTANAATFGQLYHDQLTASNGTLQMKLKFNYEPFTSMQTTGISFRMQDNQNMYRFELSTKKARLVKIVNNQRTVLAESDYNFGYRKYRDVKIKINEGRFTGYVDGVPVVTGNDNEFTTGKFGPYSELKHTLFKDFLLIATTSNDSYVQNTAIVGTTFDYITNYSDLENDPMKPEGTKWTYLHTNPEKFLPQDDGYYGLSAYHNQTVQTPNPIMDKVGIFRFGYQVQDDPTGGDTRFNSYSKVSDVFWQNVTIHRRPIARFTLTENADHTIRWNDTSYDPDRWLSSAIYSMEPTGINYGATQGIIQRKYMYITPSGQSFTGQLRRPAEAGTYTVFKAVMDEYGAWSEWYEQSIHVTIPVLNAPPTAILTFPSGAINDPTYVNSLRPEIMWSQTDPDPETVFAQFQAVVKDLNGVTIQDSGIQDMGTIAANWTWQMTSSLQLGQKYQVQVRVSDGRDWSAWSNVGWMVTNRPPTAFMQSPDGSAGNPTLFTELRPALRWNQTDPDGLTEFAAYELEISNEDNTRLVYTSGQRMQRTTAAEMIFVPDVDLPVRQKLRVRVRVHDGMVWSEFSPQTWFMINRGPIAEFTWSPESVWEGDRVTLINLSTDPDGDPLTAEWTIVDPKGGRTTAHNSWNAKEHFSVIGEYEVTLTVSDGLAVSAITKRMQAKELTLWADVLHTPQWLAIHEKAGHETASPPRDFYSGEVLVLQALTSEAPVQRLTAKLAAEARDGSSINAETELAPSSGSAIRFGGDLHDPAWLEHDTGIKDGLTGMEFTVYYQNGVVKRTMVPIRLIGSALKAAGVHRVQ
ncbi:CARDB domain-containing protein [Paenibacillus turpanensis]|uniref:CARDB domain-containing protein n=1 Tax=Paenibacillus turpanensis TaxID=2689078 RepID=UPI00140BEA05|nr:CARDB domain-containing protein [Paenibacillus turpanensis]